MLHAQGYLIEDSQDEETGGPDADGDEQFVEGRVVLDDLVGRGWYKAAEHKSDALVQPERDENRGAAETEPKITLLSGLWVRDQAYADKEQNHETPHEGHQVVVNVAVVLKSEEQILQGVFVTGNV